MGILAEQRRMARRLSGERLRILREARGLTQRAVAEALGYSDDWAPHVENGRRNVPLAVWPKYAEALGCRIEDLTGAPNVERALPLSVWDAQHPYRRAIDDAEVVGITKLDCPMHDDPTPHQALWLVYRTGLTRVLCPRCGQYQVG